MLPDFTSVARVGRHKFYLCGRVAVVQQSCRCHFGSNDARREYSLQDSATVEDIPEIMEALKELRCNNVLVPRIA